MTKGHEMPGSNPRLGIAYKVSAVAGFTVMSALVKLAAAAQADPKNAMLRSVLSQALTELGSDREAQRARERLRSGGSFHDRTSVRLARRARPLWSVSSGSTKSRAHAVAIWNAKSKKLARACVPSPWNARG